MDIKQERKHSWVSQLWLGEIPLAKAFWLYGVLVFSAVYGIVAELDTVTSPRFAHAASALMDAFTCLDIAYGIIWSVGVWRSSNKYSGQRVWKLLAKVAVFFQVITVIQGLSLFTHIATGYLRSK